MAVFRLQKDRIVPIGAVTFSETGISERHDLQRLLRDQIEVIDSELLVISEEFSRWNESRRRIDLLCIDKAANIVVVELKRSEDGGHMELQALRYSAMVSNMTFQQAVEAYRDYLSLRDSELDPELSILDFLDWDEPNDDEFGGEVRVLLVSAEFSKELTSCVLWLATFGIDIRCIRIRPYGNKDEIFLDVQQVIPLPEAEDFQIQLREKRQNERDSRRSNKDLTKFNLKIGEQEFLHLPKRRAIFLVVKTLCDRGVQPDEIVPHIRGRKTFFEIAEGELNQAEMVAEIEKGEGSRSDPNRWYTKTDELIYANGKTYSFSKMWGKNTWEHIQSLIKNFSILEDLAVEKAS